MDREPTESGKKELLLLLPTIAAHQEGNYMGKKSYLLVQLGLLGKVGPILHRLGIAQSFPKRGVQGKWITSIGSSGDKQPMSVLLNPEFIQMDS